MLVGVDVLVDVAGTDVAAAITTLSVGVGAGVGVCVLTGVGEGKGVGARAMGKFPVSVASVNSEPALIQPDPALPKLVFIFHQCSALSRPMISADAPSGR